MPTSVSTHLVCERAGSNRCMFSHDLQFSVDRQIGRMRKRHQWMRLSETQNKCQEQLVPSRGKESSIRMNIQINTFNICF